MKKLASVLLSFFVAMPGITQDSAFKKEFLDTFFNKGLGSAVNTLVAPPDKQCSESSTVAAGLLDELINKSFQSDQTCREVFTGNAGDTEKGDITYAKALAYAMAEDMCSNSELHQSFLKSKINEGDRLSSDALSLDRFNNNSGGAKSTDNVAATYALTYALGYRESSGNFIRPRDPWAKLSGNEAESGFTQTSANSLNNPGNSSQRHILPQKVFKHYISSLSNMKSQGEMAKFCLNDKLEGNQQTKLMENDDKSGGKKIAFDHEGKGLYAMFNSSSSACKSIANTSVGDFFAKNDSKNAVVKCFNDLHVNCPGFSIKYGATIARTNSSHHGPLKENQTKESPKPSCQSLFNAISSNKEAICGSIDSSATVAPSVENSSTSTKSLTPDGSSISAGSSTPSQSDPSLSVRASSDYLTPEGSNQ